MHFVFARPALGMLAAVTTFGWAASSQAQTNLSPLSGSWSGGGSIRLSDGRSERLHCRANYSARGGGGLGLSLRCASQSYKIDLRSSLAVRSDRVRGSWEERSFNAGGDVVGSARSGALHLNFSGTMTGSMSVNFSNSSQRVSIKTDGGGLSSVSLSLSRS